MLKQVFRTVRNDERTSTNKHLEDTKHLDNVIIKLTTGAQRGMSNSSKFGKFE